MLLIPAGDPAGDVHALPVPDRAEHEQDPDGVRVHQHGAHHPPGRRGAAARLDRHGALGGPLEGDTLVVEVTEFNGRNWFDRAGNFHSEALRLEERFTPISADAIHYEVTIADPNTFTEPWRISMPLYRRLEENMQLLEYRCIEFVEEFLYGHVLKEQLVTTWEGERIIVDIRRKVPPGGAFYDWYRK